MSAADDFLNSGGGKSASFKTHGDTTTGQIVRVGEPQQQTDLVTKAPKVYPSGDPVMVLPVQVQTTTKDDAEDDGIRSIWIQSGLRSAVRDAIRAAKADGLRVGGTLTVTYTSDDKPTSPGLSGMKRYSVTYAPPADGFLATPEPAATGPAAAPAAPATTAVETARQLIAAGLDDQVIIATTSLPAEAVAALRNLVNA